MSDPHIAPPKWNGQNDPFAAWLMAAAIVKERESERTTIADEQLDDRTQSVGCSGESLPTVRAITGIFAVTQDCWDSFTRQKSMPPTFFP